MISIKKIIKGSRQSGSNDGIGVDDGGCRGAASNSRVLQLPASAGHIILI